MSEMMNQVHLDMLKEVIGDDLKEILQTFLDTAPTTVEQIQQAAASGSAEDLRLHSHTLKGSSSNVGATHLSKLSLVVENRAKMGEIASAAEEISQITVEMDKVVEYLHSYMASF